MFVPQIAEVFQKAGINSLVYDPRNLGESDGLPRNEIDPKNQVSDYSDALSFLQTQETVDPNRIAFWGMSFSATIALCAASLDKRAKLCIAACPYLDLKPPLEKIPQVLAKCMADRESRLAGNPPTYLPMLTAAGKNPAGLHLHPSPEELELVLTAQERGAVNFDNRSTLETYYKFLVWSPKEVMKQLAPMPVFLIVPEQDTWSPPAKQLALFETFPSPKTVRTVPGKGHLTLFNGEDFLDLMQMQVEFLKSGFEGKLV
jgi:pimeloyl-ACP methyl ester carboxylesterase